MLLDFDHAAAPPSLPLDFERAGAQGDYPPLICDSFAGGGGASTGIEMALGRSPDIAINHNPAALALHAANHPDTLHLSENVWKVDPLDYVAGRHVGLAWFSPDCKHFSKAKGGKPVERNIRDLAWVVVMWAERVRPDVIMLENVEEFRDWGPLREETRDGKIVLLPDPEQRGRTFREWTGKLKRLGYKLEHRELRACDYGAPTIRKRLFLIARCDGQPIVWPARTHGDPSRDDDGALIQAGKLQPYRMAAETIDWSLPCPSLFDTKQQIWEKFGLRAIRPTADATQARVAHGIGRFVLKAAEKGWRPFLVNLTHGVRCESVDAPFNTITGAHKHNNDDRRAGGVNPGRPATEPLSTITANPQQGVISAFVARQFGASTGHSMEEPAHTATAGVNKSMLVAPLFQKYYGTGDGARIDEPTHTVTVKDRFAYIEAELALPPFTEEMADRAREVAAFLRAHGEWDDREFVTFDIDGVNVVMVDIGMRMLTPRELFNAQGFPPDYIIDLEYKGKPLPKSDQISCCGNSVSPPMAAALIAANCSHLSRYEVAA